MALKLLKGLNDNTLKRNTKYKDKYKASVGYHLRPYYLL